MANHRNRVSESVRMLEPLVSSLAATNKERVVIALSTLADNYEKTFRYSDAAGTYESWRDASDRRWTNRNGKE